MAREIDERHLLGRSVKFLLTAEGAARLGVPAEDPLQIRVVEIKSDQATLEIISLAGYDTEYENFTIYGDEIADIIPTARPAGSKHVTADDMQKWREEKKE